MGGYTDRMKVLSFFRKRKAGQECRSETIGVAVERIIHHLCFVCTRFTRRGRSIDRHDLIFSNCRRTCSADMKILHVTNIRVYTNCRDQNISLLVVLVICLYMKCYGLNKSKSCTILRTFM